MSIPTTPTPEQIRAIASSTAVAAEFLTAITELARMPDISVPQVQLLLQLRVHGTVLQANLAKLTGVEKSAVSRNVAKMGEGEKPKEAPGPGWVTSERDLDNRKHNLVRLTQKGQALVEEAAMRAARFLPK